MFFIAVFFTFLNQTHAETDICKLSSEVSVKYNDGIDPSHEVTLNGKTILIGGKGEKSPKNVDHLAIQRGLINCAQPILKCFVGSEKFMSKKVIVDFILQPLGEGATASSFKFNWQGSTSKKIEPCLAKVWSETRFGLIIKDAANISMPIKIN